MLRNGRYAAWFRTSRGQGTGVVELAGGQVSGRDGFFSYSGSCRSEGERFSAVLIVERHTEGAPGLFGPDKVEISVEGVCNGLVATCSGVASLVPGVPLEVTLIYSQDEASAPQRTPSVSQLRGGAPSKGTDGRRRPDLLVAAAKPPVS